MHYLITFCLGIFSLSLAATTALSANLCQGFGPQTPRDISDTTGSNPINFSRAPEPTQLNLCNIHTHTNAEHKGPGFTIFAGDGDHGGYQCNDSKRLTDAELVEPDHAAMAYHGVKPGDTIEVHWVYTSCQVTPGKGLGSCLTKACTNPELRVESQVFLVANNKSALNFMDYTYRGQLVAGLHQPKALPAGTGEPVVFAGSTTGTSFTQEICSPFQVTWSVRPQCAKLDINSLNEWAKSGNVFQKDHSHGVRQLVTAPELLAPIN
ncbi:delta-class carbonic anhydrase [Roseibium sp.]|uniref:delta-class carbonic anhydrase n=1 Tax=Roseibium sp. TaxID=1936156 RepID=UPI003A980F41